MDIIGDFISGLKQSIAMFLINVAYVIHHKHAMIDGILLFLAIQYNRGWYCLISYMLIHSIRRVLLYKVSIGKLPLVTFGSESLGKSIGFMYDASISNTIRKVKLVYGIKDYKNITIPDRFINELTGLSEATKLPVGYFKTLQLVPDLSHYAGCTTLVGRCEAGDVIMFRHMDWIPYGNTAGELVRMRIGSITIFTIPGMMGAVTGYNDHGLTLAMNTAPCETYKGIPAIYLNRMILEKCKSVEEAIDFVSDVEHRPFRAYHLTIADANDFARITFYHAREHKPLIIRSRETELTRPNEAHTENPYGIIDTFNFCEPNRHYGSLLSDTRSRLVNEFLRNNEFSEDSMMMLAKMRPINNHITCQSYIFNVSRKTFSAGFNNGFAGDADKHSYQF